MNPSRWPDPPPQPVVRFVLRLRRFLKKLVDRWIPELTLFEDTVGVAITQLLGAAARYRIADILEADGPQTAQELANRLDLQSDPLHRALRVLVHKGYFRLGRDGRFANNKLSRALLSSRQDRGADFSRYFASASNVAAWGALDEVLKKGGNGFQAAHGCSVWDWFSRHPEEESTFAAAMQGRTYADAPTIAQIYPFAEVRKVCDVGGGRGGLISEIVIRHPHLEATLIDVPGVLTLARETFAQRGIQGKIALVQGDIFHSLPGGHDLYILKNVLHDWSDVRCGEILGHCVRAMGPSSRLLIVEYTLERDDAANFGAVSDAQMMMVTDDGMERSLEHFRALLEASGLELCRVFATAGMTLLEARLG